VVPFVFESVGKQTGSAIFAARHSGKQHEWPPREINPGHFTNGEAVSVVVSLWKNVDRFYEVVSAGELPLTGNSKPVSDFGIPQERERAEAAVYLDRPRY
jgi:hypothetical protein